MTERRSSSQKSVLNSNIDELIPDPLQVRPHRSKLITILQTRDLVSSSKTYILAEMVLSLLLAACSTSVLIRPDDPVFIDAQQRLERTAKVIEELKPSPLESTLFLQAESFYRYRFEPPTRGMASYLAEAAAAITDFPAFQSLASALELQDLRYRASDSAVQLWESLLARYPRTNLKSCNGPVKTDTGLRLLG